MTVPTVAPDAGTEKLIGRAALPLTGRVATVTGASSGIGRAIALELARHGARLCLIGRDAERLEETKAAAQAPSEVTTFQFDLTAQNSHAPFWQHLQQMARLDILVHGAGVFHQDPLAQASVEDFDWQYQTNVRAPYALTQRVLPLLTAARGQIVFLNSSLGQTVKRPEVGQYAATKHALKAVADSLREELNPQGVRVLSVYLGRTATPMQEALSRQEGRDYRPDTLLQPEDVASFVIQALLLPPTAEVTDISIRPMQKSS